MLLHGGRFAVVLLTLVVLASGAALAQDSDGDSILDDGDASGTAGDAPCTGGATASCDDNCISVANAGQEDLDADGQGNVCDAETLIAGSVTISAPATFASLRIASTGVLTADAVVTVTGDMTIEGTVTHSARLLAGLVLDVAGSLTIASGGAIDVSGKGLRGGWNGSIFGGSAESYDATGTTITGCCADTGGNYGGWGGDAQSSAGAPYGLVEDPAQLGSGGGGSGFGAPGSHGGGRVTITAASLVVDGGIHASVNYDGSAYSAGSGGAVKITVSGQISGSGTIEANGGDINGSQKGGGGGRVALLEYTSLTLPRENIHAYSGVVPSGGLTGPTAGTVFLKGASATFGELYVDNRAKASGYATPIRTEEAGFSTVVVRNSARLGVTSADIVTLTIGNPIEVSTSGIAVIGAGVTLDADVLAQSGGTLILEAGSIWSGSSLDADGGSILASTDVDVTGATDLQISSGGKLEMLGGSTLSLPALDTSNLINGTLAICESCRLDLGVEDVTIGGGAVLVKDGAFGATGEADEISSLSVLSGGMVTHSPRLEAGLVLNVTGTLDVDSGGALDVAEKGLRGGKNGSAFGDRAERYDAAFNIVPFCNECLAGGSYGGWGFNALDYSAILYDNVESPQHLGSGGSGHWSNPNPGSHGGGRITIQAQDLIVDGMVRADGGHSGGAAAGSGGAILVQVSGEISGNGTIEADGGNVSSFAGTQGSGGGGRIALKGYDDLSVPLDNIHAYSGQRGVEAGQEKSATAGTVFLLPSGAATGDVLIKNRGDASTYDATLQTEETGFRRVEIFGAGTLAVDSGTMPALVIDDELSVVGGGSRLTAPARDLGGLIITVPTLTLTSGGAIDLTGKGLLGGGDPANTFGGSGESYIDPDLSNVVSGSSSGAGGSYGGQGGGSGAAASYGSDIGPRSVGGGGSRDGASGKGGAGGGRVRIDADVCTVGAGSAVRADGSVGLSGSGGQGGGAGGAIRMACVTLNGGGEIVARGGAGTGTPGHGGGGGRIKVNTSNNNWLGSIDVGGGAGVNGGSSGASGSFGMIEDLVPPTVTGMNIPPGTTYVGPIDRLEITFSENLYEGTSGIDPDHVLLTDPLGNTLVPASIDFDTGTQTLTAIYPTTLRQGNYTLMLVSGMSTAGLGDSSGLALDGEYLGSLPSGNGAEGGDFMVTFGVDTPPRVVDVRPEDLTIDVPPAALVRLRFTEPLNTSTVTSASVLLLDITTGATVPVFPPVVDPPGHVTLDPVAPLALGHLYRVVVTPMVTDETGNPAVLFSSRFRTVSTLAGDVTLPTVSEALAGLGVTSSTGTAVAKVGDLDGDGLDDLLVGAPGYAVSGAVEAGAAAVYLGSTDPAERATPDIIFTGGSAHDRLGASVAGGFDFNGDGSGDLLIGAPQVNLTSDDDPVAGCDAGAPCGKGKVYVVYFDPADYPNLGNPSVSDIIGINPAVAGGSIPGLVIEGEALGDEAGFAVHGGPSLTPDAIDDIAIGAPGADGTSTTDSGAVYVIFGSTTLSGVRSLADVASGTPGAIPGRVYLGTTEGGRLGASVRLVGDVTGVTGAAKATSSDGDLLMGAPNDDGQDAMGAPVTQGGKVYIATGGDMDTDEVFVDSIGVTDDGAQIAGTQPFEHLGTSVDDGGDNLADGETDLLVGAPDYDADLLDDAGRVIQTSTQLTSGIYLADEFGTTQDGVIWTGADAGDALGTAVAGVGDVTGDGFDDIALGAPLADPVIDTVTYTDAGAVYLIEGAPSADGSGGVVSVSEVGETVAGEVLVGTQVGELAGSALAGVGDLDGNGDADFVVGAPLHDVGGDLDSGIVYVVLESEPPDAPGAGECDVDGCIVFDDTSGALLDVSSGALAGPVTLGITALDASSLPGAPPAGMALVAGVDLTPHGLVLSHAVVVYLPVLQSMLGQVAASEALDLLCWDTGGSNWVDTGVDAVVGAGPGLPGSKAAAGLVTVLRTCAVFVADGDGDGVRDTLDNCVFVPNASQLDTNGDGAGDACGSNPRFRVSSDPLDQADFLTIQAAVDEIQSPGSRIEVLPGTGTYAENVVLDRDLALSIVGAAGGAPVVVHGTGGSPAIDVVSTSGGVPIHVSNLTLGGSAGIRAAVSTRIQDVAIDDVGGTAIELLAGTHLVEHVTIDGALDGIDLAGGATLLLREVSIEAATGAALSIHGTANVETVLVATSGQGVVVGVTGSADITGCTIAGQGGAGIDASSGGGVSVLLSIVHDNAGGDLVGVSCTDVSASLVGSVDCTASNGNLFDDPLLDVDYRPGPGSPVIDAGTPPALYDGWPCNDLSGGPRLLDGDGDALADGDIGAYEHVPPAIPPGAVMETAWDDEATLTWQVNPDAVEYHVYRGDLASLGFDDFGVCRDDLDPVRSDELLSELDAPPPGTGWFYVITAESLAGVEGTAGAGTCAERSRYAPCP